MHLCERVCRKENARSSPNFIHELHCPVHAHYVCVCVCVCVCVRVIFSVVATHLREVLRYLEKQNLVSRWRRIGLELQLTYDDLSIIKRDSESVEDCAAGMLHQWLRSGSATKQALLEAIQMVK